MVTLNVFLTTRVESSKFTFATKSFGSSVYRVLSSELSIEASIFWKFEACIADVGREPVLIPTTEVIASSLIFLTATAVTLLNVGISGFSGFVYDTRSPTSNTLLRSKSATLTVEILPEAAVMFTDNPGAGISSDGSRIVSALK